MKGLLLLVLSTASLLVSSGASAHCDQIHGHQGAANPSQQSQR